MIRTGLLWTLIATRNCLLIITFQSGKKRKGKISKASFRNAIDLFFSPQNRQCGNLSIVQKSSS